MPMPHHALSAGLAMLEHLIEVGIGIHWGPAVIGDIGTRHTMSFTAIGDTVNTASRLASMAGAGEALLSETVYASVKREFPNLESRTLSLRGKEAPVDVRVLHPSAA